MKRISLLLWLLAIGILAVPSCSTPKEISYFQDLESVEGQRIGGAKGITVRPKDKISIIVNCKSPELTALFNLPYVKIGRAHV